MVMFSGLVHLLFTPVKASVLREERMSFAPLGSIYFGGGTPSILSEKAFHQIFAALQENYQISSGAEITVEANPDDLTNDKIRFFRTIPVNRFSIGVQSFFEEDLRWMNRAHTAGEAESSIKRAQDAGFENLTIDLIYGYPLLTDSKWLTNIRQALDFQIPHISAYSLTVEERTALATAIKKGREAGLSDGQSAAQFTMLTERLTGSGFEHYEISNFARDGKYAVHNTNYWKGIGYLGIGPSAHGFEEASRYFNVANNNEYLKNLLNNKLAETVEHLTPQDQFNEYIMTSLRTMWGVDLEYVKTHFDPNFYNTLVDDYQQFIDRRELILNKNILTLSPEGKLYADHVASSLFILNND